jgi:hypothetical protein
MQNGTAVTGRTWYFNSFSDGNLYIGIPTVIDALTVTPSGNVGIGVTPSAWKANHKALQFGPFSTGYGSIYTDDSGNTWFNSLNFQSATTRQYITTGNAAAYRLTAAGQHQWYTDSVGGVAGGTVSFTQAMTLDASGNLLVGTTSVTSAFNTKLHISSDSGTTKWAVGPYSSASNFVISAAGGGGVYLNGTAATSWTSASDERLKDIIEPISNAVAKVGSLRAVIGKFKFDENNTRKPFLIAQDLQSVLPEAVDASNPDQLGVAYTDVIPLLVAAIKELTARVQTLEAK